MDRYKIREGLERIEAFRPYGESGRERRIRVFRLSDENPNQAITLER